LAHIRGLRRLSTNGFGYKVPNEFTLHH
jgi:hypothetical protein